MIFNMEKVPNSGTITPGMKATIQKERSMGLEHTLGKMALNTLVYGRKTEFMVKVDIHGTMAVNMKEIGKIITWTDMEHILGKTVENMLDNIKETKNTVSVYTLGPMGESMTVNGRMEDSMGMANTYPKLVNLEKVFGIMVKEKNGWTKKMRNDIS
jgi:hypothetical protein